MSYDGKNSSDDFSDSLVRGRGRYANDEVIENPGRVDEGKWEKAKAAAEKSGHQGNYAVVTTIYKSMGGVFSHKS